MKKILTLCAATLMSLTVLFAQQERVPLNSKQAKIQQRSLRAFNSASKGAKVSGNPNWNDTMSYCGNAAFASSVGYGSTGNNIYWGIKLEAAALAGRNSITDVEIYIYSAGTYTMNIAYGSSAPGTPVLTQSITATTADEQTWKNIHLSTPLSITANQDMWIYFVNSDVQYPASGITGNSYDNGKYLSTDGSQWVLSTAAGVDYTWMIRAISDTFTPQPPAVTIAGPAIVLAGDTADFTAMSTNADSYVWTIAGADYSTSSSNTARAMWNTTGAKQVIVAATNTVGTTYDTLDVNVISCDPITTLPWFENFESPSPCWQIADNDNDNTTWGIGDVATYSHSGANALYCMYSTTQADDWAISPAITLPADATGINLSWYVRARSTNFPETYEVLISTNGTALTAFDSVFGETYGDVTYAKRIVNLAAYAGQTINIAFRYRSTDMYTIFIDDVRIGGAELPENVTIAGPTEVIAGSTATFVASAASEGVTFYWAAPYAVPATHTGDTFVTSWATAGNYQIILTAVNSVGQVQDTLNIEVYDCSTITTLPYVVDFSTMQSLRCWSAIDANNDGFTWSIMPEYGAVNYSYDNENESAITPDDYLVSPAITLPASGNFELYYKVYGGDQNYVAENYSVYVSTGNTAADFTNAIFTETLTTGEIEHTLSLNSYAGQTVHIAFRHHNCSDMFVIVLESVEVRGMTAPSAAISAPATAIAGNTVTLTANADNYETLSWTIEGATPSTATTPTVDVVWSNAGTYTITLTATNAVGSTNATATINVISCDPITSFPYTQNFESTDGYDCWTLIDADGDGFNWMPGFAFSQPQGHYNSSGVLTSASYDNSFGALTPDNWIFTPALQIPDNANFELAWYAAAQDPDYADEYYSVYISTEPTTTMAESTTPVFEGMVTADWARQTVDLSAYNGQTVYVGFRHHNCSDMFFLKIDDLYVGTAQVGIDDVVENNISVYPNPTSGLLHVDGEGIVSVEILDVNGRTVMNTNGGTIDLSTLDNGVYMVRTTTDNGVSLKKIVKK